MIEIKAKGKQRAEIRIYGYIGEGIFEEGTTAKTVRKQLDDAGEITDIDVYVNSPGGNVWDGIAIANILRSHQAQVHAHVEGLAASAASVITSGADLVTMGKGTTMMVHSPWALFMGNAEELRGMADTLDKVESGMLDIYEERTGKPRDELEALLRAESWMTAPEAVELGFADDIAEKKPSKASAAAWTGAEAVMASFRKIPEGFSIPHASAGNQQSAAAGASLHEEEGMNDNAPASGQKPDNAAQAAADEARTAERARVSDITALCSKFGMNAEFTQKAITDGLSKDEVNAQILEAKFRQTEGGTPGHADLLEDEHDKRIRGIEGGLLARAPQALNAVKQAAIKHPDRKDFQGIDNGGEFRGMSLYDLARDDLERMAPGSTRNKSRRAVVSAFFSAAGSHQTTSDFSVALENTLNKVLLASYALTDDTWREFCAVGEVSDFRVHNRYRTGFIASLDEVFEEGEFKNKTIPDAVKETIQASTYGNIVGLSRKAIINDDMGVFNRVAFQVGRAAGLTIEELVYALLAQNSGLGPAMNDAKTLFHADHDNIGTGAALSAEAIDKDAELLESQTDPSGNEYLALRPSVLLVPRGLRGTAITINESQFDPDTADSNKPNIVLGLFSKVVATPRLSGTRRYLFADPNAIPALEVAFLNGEQQPYMEMKDGWTTDGVEWKVRHDVGVSAVDYRAAVTNAGG